MVRLLLRTLVQFVYSAYWGMVVTIVAHSNGGLVAKALLEKLGDTEAAKLVDKVIMVAVPQTGAPADIGSTLVGYGAGIYADAGPIKGAITIVSNKAARAFSQNSPMAYHLLPSADYLASIIDELTHPVVHFSGEAYATERSLYGNSIVDLPTLDSYLTAAHGEREKPAYSDLLDAQILSPSLISYANTEHSALDAWVPPTGIEVDQIAGWGVDTVAGIDFYTQQATDALSAVQPTRMYRPIFIEDGDGTVPVPSALAMNSSTNVRRYWVDLYSYNKLESSKRSHSDIFEVPQLEEFIQNILTNSTSTPPSYIQSTSPTPNDTAKKLTFFLHSPLTLQLTDASGNVTGLAQDGTVAENIPGSTYGEFGEVKYVTVPGGSAYQLTMHGLASGTFSLDIQESSGSTITASSTIAGVPTTASTVVAMSVQSGLSTLSPMTIDENGDGVVDTTITPKLGDTVVFDTTPPELQITFSTTTDEITFTGSDDSGAVTVTASTTYPELKKKQKEYKGIATTAVTAEDSAGNTTVLTYTEKLPSPNQRDVITFQSISYNRATTTLMNSGVSYKWRINKRKNVFDLFASNLHTASSTIETHYRPKKDKTIVMTRPEDLDDEDSDDRADTRPVRQTLPGMVVPYMVTEKGSLIIKY